MCGLSLLELLARPDWVLRLPPSPEQTEVMLHTFEWDENECIFDGEDEDQEAINQSSLPLLRRLKGEIERLRPTRVTIDRAGISKAALKELVLEPLNKARGYDIDDLAGKDTSSLKEAANTILQANLHDFGSGIQWRLKDLAPCLRQLDLTGCGLTSDCLEPLAEFLTGNSNLTVLSLDYNDVLTNAEHAATFAKSIKHSVLADLSLNRNVSRGMEPVEAFLGNLDSSNLHTLDMSAVLAEEHGPAESVRFGVAVSAFLRRSSMIPSHRFGSRPLELTTSKGSGCPQLTSITIVDIGRKHRLIGTMILAGQFGSFAYCFSKSKPRRLPEIKDGDWFCAPNLTTKTGIRLDIRLVDTAFSPLLQEHITDSHWEEIARSSRFLLGQSVEEVVRNDATIMKDAFNFLQGKVSSDRYYEFRLAHIARAACQLLAGARVTGLNVRSNANASALPGWLRLPPELRTACLRELDEQQCLSMQQQDAVISFASDRRTIGYGRCNESTLLPLRLYQESKLPILDPAIGVSIIAAPAWSFKAALDRMRPWDWRGTIHDNISNLLWRTFPSERSSAATGFLMITDCASIRRVPSHIRGMLTYESAARELEVNPN